MLGAFAVETEFLSQIKRTACVGNFVTSFIGSALCRFQFTQSGRRIGGEAGSDVRTLELIVSSGAFSLDNFYGSTHWNEELRDKTSVRAKNNLNYVASSQNNSRIMQL